MLAPFPSWFFTLGYGQSLKFSSFFYVWQKAKGGGWSQRKSKMLEHLVQKQFAPG